MGGGGEEEEEEEEEESPNPSKSPTSKATASAVHTFPTATCFRQAEKREAPKPGVRDTSGAPKLTSSLAMLLLSLHVESRTTTCAPTERAGGGRRENHSCAGTECGPGKSTTGVCPLCLQHSSTFPHASPVVHVESAPTLPPLHPTTLSAPRLPNNFSRKR